LSSRRGSRSRHLLRLLGHVARLLQVLRSWDMGEAAWEPGVTTAV
jgi:hypothetical protein